VSTGSGNSLGFPIKKGVVQSGFIMARSAECSAIERLGKSLHLPERPRMTPPRKKSFN
jgi:hypothetical protein